MSLGKGHYSFNSFIGILIFIILTISLSPIISLSFFFGFMFSTLFFSPDLDLGPRKKWGLAGIILYPYSIFFKHRGLSHSFIFGTLSRIIYALFSLCLLVLLLNKLEIITFSSKSYIDNTFTFLKNFNYNLLEYKITVWTFLGMFTADALHILLDKMSSVWTALRR